MKHMYRWTIVLLILAGLPLTACAPKSERAEKINPVKLQPIEGTNFKRVILTKKAAERIDVRTALVDGKTIPYAALIYDAKGNTYVYTSPESLTFERKAVAVDRVEGDKVILAQHLNPDTALVTIGVSELYGAETGVSK